MSKPGGHRRGAASAAAVPDADAAAPRAQLALPAPPSVPPPPFPPAAPPSGLAGVVSTLAPITAAPPVVPRPQVTLVPHGRGRRKADRREQRRKQLRTTSVVSVVLAIIAVVAGLLVNAGGGKAKHLAAAAAGTRTQHTVFLSLAPAGGAAVEGVLLGHDSGNGQGVVVLVPSDMLTEVAGHGNLNLGDAADFGVNVPSQTLSDLISVTVDSSWMLTPAALTALVDHLGGITVDVPIDIPVNGQVVVSAGNQQLINGTQAAALATYIASDEPSTARLARFQTVLVGVLAKLGTDPASVSTVLGALSSGSTFGTDAAVVPQVLAGLDSDAKSQNVAYLTLPTTALDTGSSQEQLAVDGTGVAQMVKQYFSGSVPAGRVAGRNRVIVFNGTGQLGLGASARNRLTAHGLVFVSSANQPGFPYVNKTSVVLVPDATPDSLAAGNRVAAALGLPASDVEVDAQQDTTAADVMTILGDDYKP